MTRLLQAAGSPPRPRRGRRLLRPGAGLLDQVVSGASNVLAVVLVARALSADAFGEFALAYAGLTVTLTVVRSLLASRISLSPDDAAARAVTVGLVTGVLWLSPLLALCVLAVSAVSTGGQASAVAVAVACVAPVVCLQDLLRYSAVATGRPGRALASDAVWLAAVVLPLAVQADLGPLAAVLTWAGGAVAALLLALVLTGCWPQPRTGLRVVRQRDGMGESIAFGAVTTSAATLLVLSVAGAGLGATAAGSLRGAATAMGPVNVLLAFVGLGLVPALVRRPRERDLRSCAAAGAVLVLVAGLWGAVLLSLPDPWGRAALGESWPGVRSVLPWTVVEYLALCTAAAGALGLRVRRRGRALVRQRLVYGGLLVGAGCAAVVGLRDVRAVAAAVALAAGVLALLSWVQFLRSRPDTAAPAAP